MTKKILLREEDACVDFGATAKAKENSLHRVL